MPGFAAPHRIADSMVFKAKFLIHLNLIRRQVRISFFLPLTCSLSLYCSISSLASPWCWCSGSTSSPRSIIFVPAGSCWSASVKKSSVRCSRFVARHSEKLPSFQFFGPLPPEKDPVHFRFVVPCAHMYKPHLGENRLPQFSRPVQSHPCLISRNSYFFM